MTGTEIVKVLGTLMRSCGTTKSKTVNKESDPTEIVTETCYVYMMYGFDESAKDDAPPPEILKVVSVELGGDLNITVTRKIKEGVDLPPHSANVHRIKGIYKFRRKKGLKVQKMLERMIFEGEWNRDPIWNIGEDEEVEIPEMTIKDKDEVNTPEVSDPAKARGSQDFKPSIGGMKEEEWVPKSKRK